MSLEVKTAYDQKSMTTLEKMDEKTVFAILDRSYALYRDKSKWLSKVERIKILEKTMELVAQNREKFALEAATEGGKPFRDSIVEVDRAIGGIKVAIGELESMAGHEIPMGHTPSSEGRMAYTKYVPRGVAIAISAFNHPFNLIVHQVIPAVATGCPVIVKPASTTPLSCRNLVNILYEAGLPEDWCKMVITENAIATKLVQDPRTAFLTFIGSGRVGWKLRSQLPPGATCALEHGGVAPAIVDASAKIDSAIPALVKGGFYHAGQVCVSVQRLYVHRDIQSEFVEKFVSEVKKLKVGDPREEATDVGPLIQPKEVDRVEEWVNEAVQAGAECLTGGKRISETCFEPTVLLNPPENVQISQHEVFGPVVCLYSFDSLDEAISRANSLPYAFQAAIFSNNLENTLKAVDDLEGLAVMVNDHTAFRVDWMPFGGYKESGLGVGGIGHTMKDMQIEKMFVFRS